MGTKAHLISGLNSFISAVGKITKVRHTSANNLFVNEFYQTTYNQANTPAGNQFTYNLNFKKIGNIVYIDGFVRNDFETIQGNQIVCTIEDPLYFAKTGQETIIEYTNYLTKQSGLISMATSSLFLLGNEGSGAYLYINAHYQTND